MPEYAHYVNAWKTVLCCDMKCCTCNVMLFEISGLSSRALRMIVFHQFDSHALMEMHKQAHFAAN